MSKREFRRYTKRLETEFTAGGMSFRGISSDISAKGLFIRTQHGFVPGTKVNITLQLPDGNSSRLTGVVRRTIKTPLTLVKNGMGIELTQVDDNFRAFIKRELEEDVPLPHKVIRPEPLQDNPRADESRIITCPTCNVKNRVRVSRLHLGPKCGKCGTPLL